MVTDASIWVSWLVTADSHHATVIQWFEASRQNEVQLIAPWLLVVEVAGAISRRTGSADSGIKAVETIFDWGVRVIVPDRRLWARAANIASSARLRGSDALYVATAHSLRLPLATLDAEQARRASPFASVIVPGSF